MWTSLMIFFMWSNLILPFTNGIVIFFWGMWLLYNYATLFTCRIIFQCIIASTCIHLASKCMYLAKFQQKNKWLIWVILGPCHHHNNNSPMHPYWTTKVVVIFQNLEPSEIDLHSTSFHKKDRKKDVRRKSQFGPSLRYVMDNSIMLILFMGCPFFLGCNSW